MWLFRGRYTIVRNNIDIQSLFFFFFLLVFFTMLITHSSVAVENILGHLSVNKEGKAVPELRSSFSEGDAFLDCFASDEVVGDVFAVLAAVTHGLEAHGDEVPFVQSEGRFELFSVLFFLCQECQRAFLLFSFLLVGLRICIMESEVKSSLLLCEPRDGGIEGEVSSIGGQISIEKLNCVFAFATYEAFIGSIEVEVYYFYYFYYYYFCFRPFVSFY